MLISYEWLSNFKCRKSKSLKKIQSKKNYKKGLILLFLSFIMNITKFFELGAEVNQTELRYFNYKKNINIANGFTDWIKSTSCQSWGWVSRHLIIDKVTMVACKPPQDNHFPLIIPPSYSTNRIDFVTVVTWLGLGKDSLIRLGKTGLRRIK